MKHFTQTLQKQFSGGILKYEVNKKVTREPVAFLCNIPIFLRAHKIEKTTSHLLTVDMHAHVVQILCVSYAIRAVHREASIALGNLGFRNS